MTPIEITLPFKVRKNVVAELDCIAYVLPIGRHPDEGFYLAELWVRNLDSKTYDRFIPIYEKTEDSAEKALFAAAELYLDTQISDQVMDLLEADGAWAKGKDK